MFSSSINAGGAACTREQASLARLSQRADRPRRAAPVADARRRGGSDEDRPQPPWRKKHARKGKSYENQRRRRGRPEFMRSPDDTPLRDGNRDRLIGLLTLRAAKTLSYYLYETNPNVYHWLVVFIKENPIPQDGAWDDVSGDTFLRKLLSMPIEHTSDGMKRSTIYTMNKGCGVDPRNIAQRIMEIRTVIAKEMTQDLADIGEENSVLMRETLQASLQLSLQNVVAHPLESAPEGADSPPADSPSPAQPGPEQPQGETEASASGSVVQPPAPLQQQQPQQQQQAGAEQPAEKQPAAEEPAEEQQLAAEANAADAAAAQPEAAEEQAAAEQSQPQRSQPEAAAAQPAAEEAAKQPAEQQADEQQAAKEQTSSAEASVQPSVAEASRAAEQPAAEGTAQAEASAAKPPKKSSSKRAKKVKPSSAEAESADAGSEQAKGSDEKA